MTKLRFVVAAILLITAAACSSSSAGKNGAKIAEPDIAMTQLNGPSDFGSLRGPITIQFGLLVTNHAREPITLRRIELANVGGGAYQLYNQPIRLARTVQPNETAELTISAPAFARGGTIGNEVPVTVRAIATFDAPGGSFQNMFFETFGQR
jgi:hypothetical protein